MHDQKIKDSTYIDFKKLGGNHYLDSHSKFKIEGRVHNEVFKLILNSMDIDLFRKICLSLPAVTEDVKWENLVFSVGERMFCMIPMEEPLQCSFKVSDEEFEELSMADGFMAAPYLARAKWVLVTKPSKLTKKDWEGYIKQSYELVKRRLTKKVREQLGI